MKKILHSNPHGPVGISLSAGKAGFDGVRGKNIYFGYVNDFFKNVKMLVDNFVRVASKSRGSGYYTGLKDDSSYSDTGKAYMDIVSNNQYREYTYTYNDESTMSDLYVKAEKYTGGWSNNLGGGFTGSQNPYNASPSYVKPTRVGNPPLGDFEPFMIYQNGKTYGFMSPVSSDKEYEHPVYTSKQKGTSKTNPSIETLRDDFVNGVSVAKANYVKYKHNAVQYVSYADTLKDEIQVGDTIYFYTNTEAFDYDAAVEYMVTITPQLIGCTVDQLIASAQCTNPFSYQYVDSQNINGKKYLIGTSKASCVHYSMEGFENAENADELQENFGKNFSNFVGYGSPYILNVGQLRANGKVLSLKNVDNGHSLDISSSADEQCVKLNASSLRFSDLYIRKNNKGNVEPHSSYTTNRFITDSFGYIHSLSEDDFDYAKKSFIFRESDYLADSSATDYSLGCYVYTYDQTEQHDDAKISLSTSFNGKSQLQNMSGIKPGSLLKLDETYGDETAHLIMPYLIDHKGSKHYGRKTFAKYDAENQNYTIYVLGENGQTITDTEQNNGEEIFDFSGMTADGGECYLTANIPDEANNIRIYINSNLVYTKTYEVEGDLDKTNIVIKPQSYGNSWISTMDVVSGEDGDLSSNKVQIKMKINDNIPQYDTADVQSAADFYQSPGIDDMANGCSLFKYIMEGKSVSTNNRSATITLKYTDVFGANEQKVLYRITQPGISDTRKIPEISLNLQKDMSLLESANNMENGVLCNQFQFFVDIDIKNFTEENWGILTADGTSQPTLNFDITNCPVDYEFINKYSVSGAKDMYTYHAFVPKDDSADYTNNYVSIKTYIVDKDISNPYEKTQNELYESHSNHDTSKIMVSDAYQLTKNSGATVSTNNGKSYVKFTKPLLERYNDRSCGVDDTMSIKFRGLTFDDVKNGKYRFRVVIECGNPLFSRLFFRYYVSELYIECGTTKFHLGTNTLAKRTALGGFTTYEYLYATDTFNVFLCPISYTSIPQRDGDSYLKGTVKKSGSENQISMMLQKYVKSDSIVSESMSDYVNYQVIPWSHFKLKTRYLQDNIQNLSVKPFYLDDYWDMISGDDYYKSKVERSTIKSTKPSESFMSVVFNSNLYAPKMREDEMSFYYNEDLISASKYEQYPSNAPLFIREEFTRKLREDSEYNAIGVWNMEYQTRLKNTIGAVGTFMGALSAYGNGYMYLKDDADENQYSDKESIHLTELKELANKEMMRYEEYANCLQPVDTDDYTPELGQWWRTLLYSTKWQYPKCQFDDITQKTTITAYDIVSDGAYMYGASTNKIPYSHTYSIYPRCAYNDEDDATIVFMLRCPSVVSENKYEMTKGDLLIPDVDEYTKLGNVNLQVR